jgi:hypothetical protein
MERPMRKVSPVRMRRMSRFHAVILVVVFLAATFPAAAAEKPAPKPSDPKAGVQPKTPPPAKPPQQQVQPIKQAPQTQKPPAAEVKKPAAPPVEKKKAPPVAAKQPARKNRYFSAAIKIDALVPPRDVSATVAVTVELRYLLPFHENRLSLGAEVGWYALSGSGTAHDADLGDYRYNYYMNNIPIFIGPMYELPIPGLDKVGLDIFLSGGFAMVISRTSGLAFGTRNHAGGTALGYYAGAGIEYNLWIGRILAEFRYNSAWTDFGLPQEGGKSGDLGGMNVFVGWRFVI